MTRARTHSGALSMLILIIASLFSPAAAQEVPRPLTSADFHGLQKATPRRPTRSAEWTLPLPAAARRGAVARLRARGRRPLTDLVARERNPKLAEDRLVVTAVDAAGNVLDWRVVPDPRVVRSEHPDATGVLSGTVLTLTEADLQVPIAANAQIAALHVYKPRWTGVEWTLDPIALSLNE